MVLGVLGLVVLLGGFGAWAATSRIAGAIIAPGAVAVESNRQVVQHPDGGLVREILVREGDEVAAGSAMVRLDDTVLATRAEVLRGQLWEVEARAARRAAERDGAADAEAIAFPDDLLAAAAGDPEVAALVQGQRDLLAATADTRARQVEQLRRRQDQIAAQIEGTEAQQAALVRQRDLIESELADQQGLLDRGLTQATRVLALQRQQAGLEGQVGELVAAAARLEGQRTEIDIQILRLDDEVRQGAITELRDLRAQALQLRAELRAAEDALSRLVIAAPVDGVVYDLQVFGAGAVIRPADPVAYLVPQDRPLVIQARIAPTDVDQVFPGQPVTLRLPTFDARTTPELFGSVVRVSPDAFTDQATGATFYAVEVLPDAGELDRLPPEAVLLPGMPVETYLRTTDRTPIAYLVKPLADYFARAFRE
ncbi:HlyD family type I secretion periplasmic adaptor subunit [Jannaschia sp. Os4]|nr:HlyD family type I secretion periplasmic adaptor subunit [Jannaschia sp. Os4]MBM2575819.1 HlyD family type I secretion periplasmic adaptor subunit [Jannaschia sp. Os4]